MFSRLGEDAGATAHAAWLTLCGPLVYDGRLLWMNESLSALFQASTSGNVGVINLLLKKGADVAVTDKDGVTTLMSAASHGHAQVT